MKVITEFDIYVTSTTTTTEYMRTGKGVLPFIHMLLVSEMMCIICDATHNCAIYALGHSFGANVPE